MKEGSAAPLHDSVRCRLPAMSSGITHCDIPVLMSVHAISARSPIAHRFRYILGT